MSCALRGHRILIALARMAAHTHPASLLRMPTAMTATSSIRRLWLAAFSLLMAAVPCGAGEVPGAEVALTWISSGYGELAFIRQDQLEGTRGLFSPFETARCAGLNPVAEGGMDLDLPSMLDLTKTPAYVFNTGWYLSLSSAKAIRLFQFEPSQHTGWITLADVQPPQVTTEYHKVVIRLLRAYGAWKSEAVALLLKTLNSPHDPGFLAVIEWELNRPER